tara:strand:- start:10894 stop:11586 length:693 start_codon:yes stop_codon:yes gene_type:complete
VSDPYLSKPRTLQFWASTCVVLPVFVQAPWVHIYPISALLFTAVLLLTGIVLIQFLSARFVNVGALFIGISGSWLGGCLFWGWLRSYPIWHLPVESIALPIAIAGLNTRWRIGAGFYLASLLGTAITDLMILCTGVMKSWPEVVNANFQTASQLLHQTSQELISPENIGLLIGAAGLIAYFAYLMNQKAVNSRNFKSTWLVASAALITTLWVDGLFFITTLFQPQLSGLI